MSEEVVVYKIREIDMGEGEKKYSQLGNLEAHYYFAKANKGKVLFTTKSKLFRKDNHPNLGDYLLLAIPDGSFGFLARVLEKGRYDKEPSDPEFKVPCQWSEINKSEKEKEYNWIALELTKDSGLRQGIPNVPKGVSPRYMSLEDVLNSPLAK